MKIEYIDVSTPTEKKLDAILEVLVEIKGVLEDGKSKKPDNGSGSKPAPARGAKTSGGTDSSGPKDEGTKVQRKNRRAKGSDGNGS